MNDHDRQFMPQINKANNNKICETCIKEDVCRFKEECKNAVKDITDIEGRTNVFITTEVQCKKWSPKTSVDISMLRVAEKNI